MATLITFQFGIVLLLSRIPIGHGFTFTSDCPADMTPTDPVVEVGHTLVLNCTLKPTYNGTYNASDIYFAFAGRNCSPPYVRTLSNVTAQLQLPNITIEMHGPYRCNLPGTRIDLCAVQSLHVVRRPLQPVLDGCVITNWERMECSWSPSREDQLQHTQGSGSFVQNLFYRHPSDGDGWKLCPLNVSERCFWTKPQFKMGATYCIQVNATNILKYVIASDVMCIQAQEEIVKPNPPEDVSYSSEGEGHMMLRWSPPTSRYKYAVPLVYQLAIRNEWDDQMSNFTVVGETSLKIPVVPFTSYAVQISVRPARPGFSSENVDVKFKSPATVPCKNPDTLTNAFFLMEESRKIVLYWKPVVAKDFCGPDLSYEVWARRSQDPTNGIDIWRNMSFVTPDSSSEVMLVGEEDEVTILSKNKVGVSTRLPHVVIRVPSSLSKSNASSNYRLVVEGSDNFVTIGWFATAPMADVADYTLFWCQRQSLMGICKTPIQWQNLSDAEHEYNLTLSGNYLGFQVGLAVNFLSGFTTGIMWADELYSATAKAEAPHKVEAAAPYLGSRGELDIHWTPALCIVPCAYIKTFVIFYCVADQQNKCQSESESVEIAAWKGFSYSLVNLERGSVYRIWMHSITRTGWSKPSDPVYATTAKSWVTPGAVAGIVVAVLCVGTITIGGLYIILRCLDKYRKKFVNGLNIALPPTRVLHPSTSSEVPMLGKKCEYNRQESIRSVSSGDSGRYSLTLTPASPATSPLLSKLTDANENLDNFVPGNFSKLEDTKVENDEDSTHGCVLSYTIPKVMPNGAPKSLITLPNGAPKLGDPIKPNVVLNGDIAGHTKYILPEQADELKKLQVNPRCTESDVNYSTSFNFPLQSTSGNAVDIGYTKIENLQPLYNLVSQLPSTDVVNGQSQDSDLLQFDTGQDEALIEETDLVPVIDQLLATLNADRPLLSDLKGDKPVTSDENTELSLPPPPPPRPGDDDAPLRGYAKITNTDFPNPSCSNLEWRTNDPDFSQQLPLSSWGYVDHAMFGVDSVV